MTYNFFYSGKENNFWTIIQNVFIEDFKHFDSVEAVLERQAFLQKTKIGITDMHEVCYRRNISSSDKDLFIIKLKNIFTLLDEHLSIERLILTSRTEVFGALGLLKTYFIQNNEPFPKVTKRTDKILEGTFSYKGRNIRIVVPYSPSPRLIKDNITTINELNTMYTYCLT